MTEFIRKQIMKNAEEHWPDDPEMQQHFLDEELLAYDEFNSLCKTRSVSDELIQEIMQEDGTAFWDARLSSLKLELQAADEIEEMVSISDLSRASISRILADAAAEYPVTYYGRRYEVERLIKEYEFSKFIDSKIAPKRELLVELEHIVALSCSNYNSESFRYPLTVTERGAEKKIRKIDSSVSTAQLYTGRYEFGANSLQIYSALDKITDYISERYGLDYSVELENAKKPE